MKRSRLWVRQTVNDKNIFITEKKYPNQIFIFPFNAIIKSLRVPVLKIEVKDTKVRTAHYPNSSYKQDHENKNRKIKPGN